MLKDVNLCKGEKTHLPVIALKYFSWAVGWLTLEICFWHGLHCRTGMQKSQMT